MSSSAWREISMHCKACVTGEKEKKDRKEKGWKHEEKMSMLTKWTIYSFMMKMEHSEPLIPHGRNKTVAVPSIYFRKKYWKPALMCNEFSLKYPVPDASKLTVSSENMSHRPVFLRLFLPSHHEIPCTEHGLGVSTLPCGLAQTLGRCWPLWLCFAR